MCANLERRVCTNLEQIRQSWPDSGLDWLKSGLDWLGSGLEWLVSGLDWLESGLDWLMCVLYPNRPGSPSLRGFSLFFLQGYLAHKKMPPPPIFRKAPGLMLL